MKVTMWVSYVIFYPRYNLSDFVGKVKPSKCGLFKLYEHNEWGFTLMK